MKTCTVCHETKPLSAFQPRPALGPTAFYAACRECRRAYNNAYQKAGKRKSYHAKLYVENRDEIDRRNSAWQKANRESCCERVRRYRAKDIEASRARTRKSHKKWRQNNPAKWSAISRKHALQKIRAVPAWANHFFIEEAYDLARRRSRLLGSKWHVDHVVPLRGKAVCGLHVEHNLAVIPGRQNMLKGNRLPNEG
jgi:hypothetical protein